MSLSLSLSFPLSLSKFDIHQNSVQNSFWDREPVQCLEQRADALAFAFSMDDACRIILDALERLSGGGWEVEEE